MIIRLSFDQVILLSFLLTNLNLLLLLHLLQLRPLFQAQTLLMVLQAFLLRQLKSPFLG